MPPCCQEMLSKSNCNPHYYHQSQKGYLPFSTSVPLTEQPDHSVMSRRYGGSSSGGGGKRPGGWAGVQKGERSSRRERINSAEWPIYVIGNVTFQWNHKPQSREDEERTVATLAAYMANPNDRPDIPANFRNYQPVWGIVKRGPHTTDSSTSAIADEDLHTTVKFSNQDDRENYRGYTVHIYNDSNWEYDSSEYCSWGERTPDQHQDQRVYYNRKEYPQSKFYSLSASTPPQLDDAAVGIEEPDNTTVDWLGKVPGTQPTQPMESSSSTPNYLQDADGYYYCLLSNGEKIYWSDEKHWYIDSTGNWVEYTGALNI